MSDLYAYISPQDCSGPGVCTQKHALIISLRPLVFCL